MIPTKPQAKGGAPGSALLVVRRNLIAGPAPEFPGWDKAQFDKAVEDTINNPDKVRSLMRGRTAYWNAKDEMVVIENPADPDGGTAFRPRAGESYFDNLK
jgi:hypothetical protein